MHIRDELIQLLEAIPVGIAIHQPDGSVYYINPAGEEFLGKGVEAVTTTEQLATTYQIYRTGTEQLYLADWVISFRLAAIEGDMELMLTLIEEIRSRNQSIADALGTLVKNFQFEQILNLIGY